MSKRYVYHSGIPDTDAYVEDTERKRYTYVWPPSEACKATRDLNKRRVPQKAFDWFTEDPEAEYDGYDEDVPEWWDNALD